MTFHLRYISYLLLLNVFLLSDDRIWFDLDAIENNQILLNKYNTNILDTLSYHSIIFNQNHHLPYGTFVFSQIDELSSIDTTANISQFIHKKGDFRYRDLLISLARENENNIKYQFIAHNKSYTPLDIQGLLGSSFLQNFLFDIYKQSGAEYIGSTIAYHKEHPNLPISYNFTSDDVGVYHTRESRSIIWGFQLKKQLTEKLKIEFKNSNQFSFLKNKYNISEDGYTETSNSFDNEYFTGWNIFKSNYTLNSYSSIKFNFTSFKQRQLYQDYTSTIDTLECNIETFDGILGLSIKNYFFGVNVKGVKSPFYPTHNFEITIKPYVSMNLINKKNFTFSYTHSQDNALFEIPYEASQDALALEIPILYLIKNNLSVSIINDHFYFGSSAGHISTEAILFNELNPSSYYNNDRYSRYFYCDIDFRYHQNNFLGVFGYTGYLNQDTSDDMTYMPKVNSYIYYLISYQIPIKNKPYSLSLESSGRWSHLKDGAFNLNTLPMIGGADINGSGIVHYMDLAGGLEFDNFTISYHNITNNGHDFSLESPLSDIGSSYSLPQYSFLGASLSIFHYLNISWTFID